MNSELSRRAKYIVENIKYVTVATVSEDGQPWNAPVFCAYDQNYNFYWGSYKDSQHAKNLHVNNKAFLVIYDSTVEAGQGEGVYLEAEVTELTDGSEIQKAHRLLQDRSPVPYWGLDEFEDDTPIALYKAKPFKAWMNGEGEIDGHYIDIRKEIKI